MEKRDTVEKILNRNIDNISHVQEVGIKLKQVLMMTKLS